MEFRTTKSDKTLTQEEQDTLGNLYMVANQINDDKSWNNINIFFEELGKKYDFDSIILLSFACANNSPTLR